MKNLYIFLCFLFPGLLESQESLSVSFQLKGDTLFAFDPVEIEIEIINKGIKPLVVYPISASQGRMNYVGMLDVQFRYNEDSTWQSSRQIINRLDESACYLLPTSFSVPLNAGQAMRETYQLPPVLFLTADTFMYLRVGYFSPGDGISIHSKTQKVFIQKYNMDDNEAYRYIKLLSRPNFFYYPVYATICEKTDTAYAKEIIEKFPKSRFAPYCKLFLTNYYLGLAHNAATIEKDKNKSLEHLRKTKFYGFDLLYDSNPSLRNKGDELLQKMTGILFVLFDFEPPAELLAEFKYAP